MSDSKTRSTARILARRRLLFFPFRNEPSRVCFFACAPWLVQLYDYAVLISAPSARSLTRVTPTSWHQILLKIKIFWRSRLALLYFSHFVWATLKTWVRKSVRRRRRNWILSLCRSAPWFLGGTVKASAITWNQRICNTRPVKNTLFQSKSPRLVNGRSFENWRFLDPDCSRVFILLSMFLSVVHTKWPEGHPCPAGVI